MFASALPKKPTSHKQQCSIPSNAKKCLHTKMYNSIICTLLLSQYNSLMKAIAWISRGIKVLEIQMPLKLNPN